MMGLRVLFLGLLLLSAELLAQTGKGAGKRRCKLSPAYGPCKEVLRKFYYDTGQKKCMSFVYGGCKGNNNRFETKKECKLVCEKKDRCRLPPDTGDCKENHIKYYYDLASNKCIEFVYGGVGVQRE
uniref:kunitz-type serine protease inhibitor bitisilin-2-like n=1 Tax=Euleptes europaea TaxID=460621 RepID=UPI002540E002|nr:kunitz-type serine protease inhibitor bitisilin-2-like [Euleptes europaea]